MNGEGNFQDWTLTEDQALAENASIPNADLLRVLNLTVNDDFVARIKA
jgi:hypothetical protein